jgi:hypothetical protein
LDEYESPKIETAGVDGEGQGLQVHVSADDAVQKVNVNILSFSFF